MTKDLAKDIYSQFSKKELIAVAQELEIKVAGSETTRSLAAVILKDLEENGIPENIGDISETLVELLQTAEFIDEEGNILEGEEESVAGPVVPDVKVEEVVEIPDWICFSYADPRDPACNKCKLYDPCWNRRVALRPECFGKRYLASDAECQACIEATYCMKEMK